MWFYRLKGLGGGLVTHQGLTVCQLQPGACQGACQGALAIYLARINSRAAATAEFQHALKGVQQRGFLRVRGESVEQAFR